MNILGVIMGLDEDLILLWDHLNENQKKRLKELGINNK